MLTQPGCKARQQRLLKWMEKEQWDLFLTSDYRTAYYFSGLLGSREFPTLFLQGSDGRTGLIANSQGSGYCDEQVLLETYSVQRSIEEPADDAARLLKDLLNRTSPASVRRCAVERGTTAGLYEQTVADTFPGVELEDAFPALLRLRKRKHEDEIASVKENLKYCAVAYQAAREVIAPGQTEIDVYNAMVAAVTKAAGTTITFAGDFACGERGIKGGGAPTSRRIQTGDLYILDIFPAVDLYYADTCRTFAVGEPTELQQQAWQLVMDAVRLAESLVKPGVSARSVYLRVKEFLDSQPVSEQSFWHHAGHGLGHRGHEAPRLISGSEDVFEEGDVFTLEPGIYTKALQGGIRLEDNYVLRAAGPEDLFNFPWGL
jgi:Xaa-Pro dipeptidase